MIEVVKFTDEQTIAVAALVRTGGSSRDIVRKLYEGKPVYGPGNGLTHKERILHGLLERGVKPDGKLAHAYEHGFYFDPLMLDLISERRAYRMGIAEAHERLGTISFGDPR